MGPMYVKKSSYGKIEMTVVYAALYTCATTRAVHLELTPSMEASAFLRTITRFVSGRRVPRLIVSNNFKSFVAVSGKIQAQPGASEVEQYMRGKKLNDVLTLQRPHGGEGTSNAW